MATVSASAGPIDGARFRHVLGHYPTGISVVTALLEDGSLDGMVVGSLVSISLDPPLVGFFPAKGSASWRRIASAGCFGVNVLGHHQRDLCRRLSGKAGDRFAAVPFSRSEAGAPILEEVAAWIDCVPERVIEMGDHFMVVALVRALHADPDAHPLIFHRSGYARPALLD